jgi:Protein of unknown function (DUF1566)
MKRKRKLIGTIILAVNVFLSSMAFAQAPEKMSYQAVVRDADNLLVVNQMIAMQISILQSSTAVYVETHSPTTNANGLVSLEIGNGTVVSGNFASIDWANGTYFIKTETDLAGGTNYTITATSQFLSVPYALHAKTAESFSDTTRGRYIGEFFEGGLIYYIDETGEHGRIVNLEELVEDGVYWGITFDSVGQSAQSYCNGWDNTIAIVAKFGPGNYAAKLCDDYSYDGYTDWYLPSIVELRQIEKAILTINNLLRNDGNDATDPIYLGPDSPSSYYWSSTEVEFNPYLAFIFAFRDLDQILRNKNNPNKVRAVRSF